MNFVDLLILLIVFAFLYEGQRRGFFLQMFDIIGFLISLILALTLYSQAASLLTKFFKLPLIAANPIGFLMIWLVTETIFFAVFDNIFRKILKNYHDAKVNKILGFIPATANGLLFTAFILLFIVSLPLRGELKKEVFQSKIGSYLVYHATVLEKPFNKVFGPITKQGLTFLTVKPEDKGSVKLEYTQNELTQDLDSEKRMLTLVNQERVKVGVKPLVWDESLAKVGRKHSEDMFRRGYFSHYSPEGKDVGGRLEASGINYTVVGENLALAPDVGRAHIGLINSQGHRRNILDPVFNKAGIGVVDGGIYGKMFTQVFSD